MLSMKKFRLNKCTRFFHPTVQPSYLLILCFWSILFSAQAQHSKTTVPETLRLKVVDTHADPLFGVYVVNKNKSYLLTTTDIDGECILHTHLIAPFDSIQFQGMGYKTESYTLNDLKNSRQIILESLHYELEETVIQGISTEELLDKVSSKLKKLPRSTPPYCNFYGKAQYEKITEYRDSAVEYRREYGYYFTSGDIQPKNNWDDKFKSYFVPAYTARSYNLTNDGTDTLAMMYITTEGIRFDAGTRKIFTLLRTIQLYGPLFSGTECYDFTPIDSDSLDYVYRFKTKTTAYPEQTKISCKGTLVIDFHRHILKRMTFEYIDYQLYRQVLLTNQRKVSSPFSTQAEVVLDYDEEGRTYIKSCKQESRWKYDLGDNFVVIEQPSRMHPEKGNLLEKEAFYCYNYQSIKKPLRTSGISVKIHVAQRNPAGSYDSLLFEKLPPLLDHTKAVKDLSRYADIYKQYRQNSNKTYYPDNFLNGFNGFVGVGRDDRAFRNNTQAVRLQVFELFPMPAFP